MHFLLIAHRNLRVSAQKIVQRCRARFLSPGKNEIQPLDLSRLSRPHRHESRAATLIAQLISQRSGRDHIVDLFCNSEIRFLVLDKDGRCFEGVPHAGR